MTATATLAPPPAPTGTAGTRQVNVRFDEPTRAALELVATATDRTLTQLVRYAVTWWITQPANTRQARENNLGSSPAGLGRPVNVRMPVRLLIELDQQATTNGINGTDRSNTIRTAVRTWLRAGAAPTMTAPPSENTLTTLRGATVSA